MNPKDAAEAVSVVEKGGPGAATDIAVHAFVRRRWETSWPSEWGNRINDWAPRPWGHRSPSLDVLLAEAEAGALIRRDPGAAEPAWTAKTFRMKPASLISVVEPSVAGYDPKTFEKRRVASVVDMERMLRESVTSKRPDPAMLAETASEAINRILATSIIKQMQANAPPGSPMAREAALAEASLKMPRDEREQWREGDAVVLIEPEHDVISVPGEVLRVAKANGSEAVRLERGDRTVAGEAWVANLRRPELIPGMACRLTKGPACGVHVTLDAQEEFGDHRVWTTVPAVGHVYPSDLAPVWPTPDLPF